VSVRLFNPDGLAPPAGFAHAAAGDGKPVVLAGQIGCDAAGRVEAPGDIVAQFGKALDNLLLALGAAGGAPTDIAQLRIFVTDVQAYRDRLRDLGRAYRARLGRHYPAMALLGVRELFDPQAMVEIEGLAYVG
jgi:enamine deaminase RidA (YjgF/YER057c/UK114 family)